MRLVVGFLFLGVVCSGAVTEASSMPLNEEGAFVRPQRNIGHPALNGRDFQREENENRNGDGNVGQAQPLPAVHVPPFCAPRLTNCAASLQHHLYRLLRKRGRRLTHEKILRIIRGNLPDGFAVRVQNISLRRLLEAHEILFLGASRFLNQLSLVFEGEAPEGMVGDRVIITVFE